MKFMRRPDIDNVARARIAAQAFLGLGVYGEITRIAHYYQVSRLFVYKLLWQLLTVYQLEVSGAPSTAAMRKKVDQHILLLRLEGQCSLEQISQIMEQLGLPLTSIGSISQRLAAYAQSVPKEVLTGGRVVFLVCDEIFTLGQPILISVEPASLAILKIELVEKRDAETWQKHWSALAQSGWIEHPIVVSDQGSGLVKGCGLMGLTHHPDLFHLLRPLALFGDRFYRQALAAMAWESERGQLEMGRSEAVIRKRSAAYEAARTETEEKIRQYDYFCYLWTELRQVLDLFDPQGEIPDLAWRQAEIGAILALMRELSCEPLNQELKSLATGLASYWGYYERAADVYQGLIERYPRPLVQALACGWQLQKQATNSKDYRIRQRVAQDAEFYFAYAASLLPAASDAIRQEVVEAFDTEVRSSSLVENVNSALRPLLQTCRGQVNQALLDLFAYVHNHRPFERGKRAGFAPIELLTGKKLHQTWLESLLETV